MRVLVLGGDGYLGWPTAMFFAQRGHEVAVADNLAKRAWELELGIKPLIPILNLQERAKLFEAVSGRDMALFVGDLQEYRFVERLFTEFKPDAIVHYGEQPSAPYSMIDRRHAVSTQVNNVVGNLNVIFAMREHAPSAHLIKLGTMGEYGTPNIPIEEGFIEIESDGRKDTLPFPKQPGSFYHLSKVHDSHNIAFACRVWGLRATDLNQGVVYGIETEETMLAEGLATSFHYDAVFGTALNRFCAQAVIGEPLTLYGKGGQKRGFLNIKDTIQCVAIAGDNPPAEGEYRVFNQFTEVFSVSQLAEQVKHAAAELDMDVEIAHIENPRVESEDHYYEPKHTKLLELGLKPHLLSDVLIDSMLGEIQRYKECIDRETVLPKVRWR